MKLHITIYFVFCLIYIFLGYFYVSYTIWNRLQQFTGYRMSRPGGKNRLYMLYRLYRLYSLYNSMDINVNQTTHLIKPLPLTKIISSNKHIIHHTLQLQSIYKNIFSKFFVNFMLFWSNQRGARRHIRNPFILQYTHDTTFI